MAKKPENPLINIAIFVGFWGTIYLIDYFAKDSWIWWAIGQIIVWTLWFFSILCIPFIVCISLGAIGGGCYFLYQIDHKTPWNKDKQDSAKVGGMLLVFGTGILYYFFGNLVFVTPWNLS